MFFFNWKKPNVFGFKKNYWFWSDLGHKTPFCVQLTQTSKQVISANFKDFLLIFGANESWESIFSKLKLFYPPSLVFYPSFLASTILHEKVASKFQFCVVPSDASKYKGVKTSRGVTNFRLIKYGYSAFICTKNWQKSLTTRVKS